MRFSRRFAIAGGVLLLLGVFVVLGGWYEAKRADPVQAASDVDLSVINGGDRGPGSLREALFVADAANGKTKILIRVSKITIETALPPLVNPHGISIMGSEVGAEIDAHALAGGPVLDVAGANSSISGLNIRNCAGAAVLLRAARFRLTSTTIESCDVGVEVADNASDLTLERNRFVKNRVGVRFTASIPNAVLVSNEFSADADAGVWAVRGEPDIGKTAISVRDNKFRNDRMGILAGNISMVVENNDLFDTREAAVHLIGTGAIVRGNRISGGKGMGIVAENARSVVIEKNELAHVAVYGVMVRGSANALLRSNRVHNCGYGIAFVLGDASSPSTAVDNLIIEPKNNGIDVIGDSPILRRNSVLQARAYPLQVKDYQPPGGQVVRASPLLDNNTFGDDKAAVVAAGADRLQATATPK
jgi:hypothetical protein